MIERINLVPQDPLAEKVKKAIPLVLGALVLLVVLTGFVRYQFLAYKVHKADTELTELRQQKGLTEQLQARARQLTASTASLREQYTQLKKTIAGLDITQSNKRLFSRALVTIASVLPETVKCKKINFDNETGQITGDAIKYSDLPGLVAALKNSPGFKNAVLKDIDKNSGDSNYQLSFNIQIELN